MKTGLLGENVTLKSLSLGYGESHGWGQFPTENMAFRGLLIHQAPHMSLSVTRGNFAEMFLPGGGELVRGGLASQ